MCAGTVWGSLFPAGTEWAGPQPRGMQRQALRGSSSAPTRPGPGGLGSGVPSAPCPALPPPPVFFHLSLILGCWLWGRLVHRPLSTLVTPWAASYWVPVTTDLNKCTPGFPGCQFACRLHRWASQLEDPGRGAFPVFLG